jgi:hypothetical protein
MSFSPNNFLSNIKGKGGPAKSNRFEVVIPIPGALAGTVSNSLIEKILNLPQSAFGDISDAINSAIGIDEGKQKSANPAVSRYLTLQCETAELPGKTLQTADVKIYGPIFKVPYNVQYTDMNLTFICTNDFYERKLFDQWMEAIAPNDTYNMRFPKGNSPFTGYMTKVTVIQYDDSVKQIYAVNLIDAFPIGVAAHLAPFLPGSPIVKTGGEKAIHAISAAPFGSALILLISYAYIKMLGAKGLRESTEIAILNANYIAAGLKGHYDILYTGKNGTVAHEMILDCRDFKRTAEVEVADMAKRLIDFNFHAPTVSFPVAGTLMIEPTESEDKEELDRFIIAMIKIREEIRQIENGEADKVNNLLKNAPHTADCIINKEWNYPYTAQEAAYPVAYLKEWKYWVPVRRVDNAFGDRNLVCSCPSIESYQS